MESEINKKIEDWEKEFDENFESEIKGLGEIWESHKIKSFIRQLLIQEKEKLIHDHKILVNTILEKKKQEREKLLERIENLEKENKEFKENGLKTL